MAKWIGTGLCFIGIALTSLNIYPLNLLFGLIGSFFWTVEGLVAKDYAFFVVEAVAVGMYFGGIIRVFTVSKSLQKALIVKFRKHFKFQFSTELQF